MLISFIVNDCKKVNTLHAVVLKRQTQIFEKMEVFIGKSASVSYQETLKRIVSKV